MKTLTTLLFILSSTMLFSQSIDATTVHSRIGDAGFGGSIIFNKPNKVIGSVYAFEKWANVGEINIDGKVYKMLNINFNMSTNNFESQVGNDSIFILDEKNIEYLHINNRRFKKYFFTEKNKNVNFEIVYEGEDMKLIKGYEVGIRYGQPDPAMVKETTDKYFTTTHYYIKIGSDIKEISLKKKNILSLFKGKSAAVSSYVKKNKLSYKKDRDLTRIFTYYDSL